jgi:D-alanyl-D-alanine carboxypeptidase
MLLNRRQFAGGAVGLLAAPFATRAFGQAGSLPAAALSAIADYAEAHRRQFTLPGMTVGVSLPDGRSTVLNFGYSDLQARTPIGGDTLFQIGSITKSMTALLVHQFAAQNAFGLKDRIGTILPEVPLPAGNTITVQQLLDHVSGLPDMAPLFPPGGLWTGYVPGSHWTYSNTGYELLGRLVEHAGSKPLAQLFQERIFTPLGMRRTRGAIVAADRSLYAQGYGAAQDDVPFVWGTQLAPSDWVDFNSGGGCVASTAEDMNLYLRALSMLARGKGGLGLDIAHGSALIRHAVPSDTPGMTYGNGLMHVAEGGRSYLHHTGGMVAFSSSFHLDTHSGVVAFASSSFTGFAEYRPKLLTRFAVDALTNALTGRPLPKPPYLGFSLPNVSQYLGTYSGPAGTIEIQSGTPLTIAANGITAQLQPWATDLFRTSHPQFREFTLLFERTNGAISHVSWGPHTFVRSGAAFEVPASDPALSALAGRYMNDSPWWGATRIVERGGKLWIGTDGPMAKIGDNLWRVGRDSWSPERVSFSDTMGGRPQTMIFSAERFYRQDV